MLCQSLIVDVSSKTMNRSNMRDISVLIVRLVLGIIFIFHGWDKIFVTGVDKTAGFFVSVGIPQAELTVWVVALVELIGGALLILGLLAPAVSIVLIIEMAGALWSVHWGNGLFASNNGSELVLSLMAALLLIAVFGAGKFSLDKLFTR